ncbi:MAG: ComF family protein [Chloroflexi bacterium]|nr:ComF family protein [Chloroflexota bacterium]
MICASCVNGLRTLEQPFCDTCAQPGAHGQCEWCQGHPSKIDGIRAPYLFEGPLREAVHRLKYRGWRVAAPLLGGLLAGYLEQHRLPGDIMVPVPLHSSRLRSRGYNQSDLLAREAGKLLGIPVREEILKRANDAPPQVEAGTREQRRANVAGNFESSAEVAGMSVLLVDDVATTGSTLFACAAVLKDAGAAGVWGLVLARES